MFHHLIHGLFVIITVLFGLPAILATAVSWSSTGKASLRPASRLIHSGMKTILHMVELVAEVVAKRIAANYPEKAKWLKPLLKVLFTYLFTGIGLYLVSILTTPGSIF